ncbi:hypothetical protein FAY30_20935 [Bacillus sp. S3]|uniref:hypothetical protein n=1 Tax=Bacillus sp. S3 TaxID=486398 RepID=UPI00118B5FF3|nr:hypothetical protein [Bacillus sp. S3]QCJ44173.1 hypothetical protein FAY30_20935 [Bacillus sp. S3]
MDSESKMVHYLEDKYGEKFVVEHKKEGSVLFPEMYGKDKIYAYPEGKPELIFEAGESSSKEKQYYDDYIPAIWGGELTKSLQGSLKESLPETSIYKIYVNVAGSKYNLEMKDLPILKYINEENKDIRIVLKVAIKTAGKPNTSDYSDGLYKAFDQLKGLNTTFYSFSVGFVDQSEKIDEYIRTSNVNNLPWSNIEGKVYGHLQVNQDITDINSPADLMKYYTPAEE